MTDSDPETSSSSAFINTSTPVASNNREIRIGNRSALREYIPPPPDVTFTNPVQQNPSHGNANNDFDYTGGESKFLI